MRSCQVFLLDSPLIPHSEPGVQECGRPAVKRSCTAPLRPQAGGQRGNGRGRRLLGRSGTSLLQPIDRASLSQQFFYKRPRMQVHGQNTRQTLAMTSGHHKPFFVLEQCNVVAVSRLSRHDVTGPGWQSSRMKMSNCSTPTAALNSSSFSQSRCGKRAAVGSAARGSISRPGRMFCWGGLRKLGAALVTRNCWFPQHCLVFSMHCYNCELVM